MKSVSNAGTRQTKITPQRKKMIFALSRRNYKSAAVRLSEFSMTKGHILQSMIKNMRGEMKKICSLNHNSILRGKNSMIENFTWQAIWLELSNNIPSLVNFFKSLLPKSNIKFISFLVCAILKEKCKHMSLLQRVFSVLLYSNATNKQVSNTRHTCTHLSQFYIYRFIDTCNSSWYV